MVFLTFLEHRQEPVNAWAQSRHQGAVILTNFPALGSMRSYRTECVGACRWGPRRKHLAPDENISQNFNVRLSAVIHDPTCKRLKAALTRLPSQTFFFRISSKLCQKIDFFSSGIGF